MDRKLLTAGEFAKLARTTKRTLYWYDQKGLLKPLTVNAERYRMYATEQIIDFQVISLLAKLNFPLSEIGEYIKHHKDLKSLFKRKRGLVEDQIKSLQNILSSIERYYKSLDRNGTLVTPSVKKIKPFQIYYIEVVGEYSKIKEYGKKFKAYFVKIPKDAVYLTIFTEEGYKPKNAKMKIGVIAQKGIVLMKSAYAQVKKEKIPAMKVLSYVHIGSSAQLSLLWQELARFAKKNGFKKRTNLPFDDLELYKKTSFNGFTAEDRMEFELLLPVED